MTRKQKSDIKRKLSGLEYAQRTGSITKASRHYGISKTTYFNCVKIYGEGGEQGLINNKPCPENLGLRTPN